MKKAPSVAGGAYERLRRETQHTTSSTAQPNRAMIVSRTIRSELIMSAGVTTAAVCHQVQGSAQFASRAAKTEPSAALRDFNPA